MPASMNCRPICGEDVLIAVLRLDSQSRLMVGASLAYGLWTRPPLSVLIRLP
jgi:hypothetical protein